MWKHSGWNSYIFICYCCCSPAKFVLNSLQPHGLQHARLPGPSLFLRVCSNSCPLNQWCYLTISAAASFSFCLRSFSAAGFFSASQWVIRWPKYCSFNPQRTGFWSVWLSLCPPCHLSGKSRPGSSKGVGSDHPELAPMACDLYCPKSPTLRREPPLLSLSWNTSYFLNNGSHTFVLHFRFPLVPTNWVVGPGLPVKC